MPEPLLIVVGGPPGSGKSTLARALGDAVHLPVVHRDSIKTGIHVTHGSTDPTEQRRFAGPAFDLAFDVTRTLLDAGSSVILEAAFHREHSGAPLAGLAEGRRAAWLWTRCPPSVTLERYRDRSHRGERHPAHNDPVMVEEMAASTYDWARYDPPPEVVAGEWGRIQWVDTSSGFDPSVEELAARLVPPSA